MKHQLLYDSASETIEEMPREHALSLRTLIRVGSLELPINILQKKKTLFAAGADISLARSACVLETRSAMQAYAFSSMLRMSG
jgi:hypothetical protein